MKSFKLNNGFELPIVPGFREQVKSNWRIAYKNFEYKPIEQDKATKLKQDINHATSYLSKMGISIQGKRIMDVGCYLGIQCFGAIEHGAISALGIDIPEYYINSSLDKDVNASKILEDRRNDIRKYHSHLDQSKITFQDTSVFEMDFENEFDIIFSWETFEHITNPKEALKRIYKALKPGGISYNAYNPFFCLSGGHSMCTLDFPFAHILLSNEEFKKYVEEVIPQNSPKGYAKLSYEFFTKGLNRMTQYDLRKYIDEEGFKLLDFTSIPDMNMMNLIDPSTLEIARELYPTLILNDLLCSMIYFTIQK